jgi:hypothetical protein
MFQGHKMKKLARAALSIALTFVIGVFVTFAWAHLYPRRVSLCQLAWNPAAYDGKLVRIEALGSVSSSLMVDQNYIIIFEPACAAESSAWATIHLDPDLKVGPEVEEFVNSRAPEIREAKLVVQGRFDQWDTLGCFSPQFGIRNATVTLVSPVTSKALPQMPTRDSR